jgi:hypothetical protein
MALLYGGADGVKRPAHIVIAPKTGMELPYSLNQAGISSSLAMFSMALCSMKS